MRLCWNILLILCCAAMPLQAQRHPDELTIPPLEFNLVEPERHVLSNGMIVYLLEDHELPLFRATTYFHAGSIYDPPDKMGLASLVGSVMRTGGTHTQTGDELDETLEFIAGSVESGIGLESGSVSVSVLKKDMKQGLQIFSDVMRIPEFRQEKLDLARNQMLEGLRRRNDSPGGIASREFSFQLYGVNHPLAREVTAASLNSITRDDMRQYHSRFFVPNNAILAIAGDFITGDLLKELEQLFGDWTRQDLQLPGLPTISQPQFPAAFLARKDINQSNIILGHFGMRRHDKDYLTVRIMNQILSSQRLFLRVRTDAGLAYSVGSTFTLGPDIGAFYAVMQNRADATVRAIQLVQETIGEMRDQLVTDDELRIAKDSYLNSFVFNFDSPAGIVTQAATFELKGYPSDFLKTYRDKITTITKEDIRRVAREFLHPEQAILMVVGNPELFDAPLDGFGPLTEIPLDNAATK
jgi:zinc protease